MNTKRCFAVVITVMLGIALALSQVNTQRAQEPTVRAVSLAAVDANFDISKLTDRSNVLREPDFAGFSEEDLLCAMRNAKTYDLAKLLTVAKENERISEIVGSISEKGIYRDGYYDLSKKAVHYVMSGERLGDDAGCYATTNVNELEDGACSATDLIVYKDGGIIIVDNGSNQGPKQYEDEIDTVQETDGQEYVYEIGDDVSFNGVSLAYIKRNLSKWYTDREIREVTLIVMAEDLIAQSETIWAAHVWLILDRVGHSGFKSNADIIAVISDRSQFVTYLPKNLAKDPDPKVEAVVRDVFARKVLEDMGAPPEIVGRVKPEDIVFFRSDGKGGKYNVFYAKCWSGKYDPFSSPYNPYAT